FYCPIKRACLTALLWTLFYGIHKRITAKTYALSLLFSLCGAAVSLKEARLFVCLKDKENPNTQILGFSSYSWSFILFCICIFSLSALLILHKRSDVKYNHRATSLEKILLIVLIGITLMSFYSMRTLVF
ncbi:MAG: hypothetical protein EBZ47_07990, partial [Chlamydiae bacterium]|nr:hypothetical protein [Chlamydiota bacterium]